MTLIDGLSDVSLVILPVRLGSRTDMIALPLGHSKISELRVFVHLSSGDDHENDSLWPVQQGMLCAQLRSKAISLRSNEDDTAVVRL